MGPNGRAMRDHLLKNTVARRESEKLSLREGVVPTKTPKKTDRRSYQGRLVQMPPKAGYKEKRYIRKVEASKGRNLKKKETRLLKKVPIKIRA